MCGGGAGVLMALAVDSDLAADPRSLKRFGAGKQMGLGRLRSEQRAAGSIRTQAQQQADAWHAHTYACAHEHTGALPPSWPRAVASAQVSEHALTSILLDPARSSPGRHAFYVATAGSELFRRARGQHTFFFAWVAWEAFFLQRKAILGGASCLVGQGGDGILSRPPPVDAAGCTSTWRSGPSQRSCCRPHTPPASTTSPSRTGERRAFAPPASSKLPAPPLLPICMRTSACMEP